MEPVALPNAVAVSQLDKFLLFDVTPHEQLNKQRRALMHFLKLAIDSQRTLVLPRARLLRRNGASFAKEAGYVTWSELFNISVFKRRHPAIDLEAFLEEHGQIESLVPLSVQRKLSPHDSSSLR